MFRTASFITGAVVASVTASATLLAVGVQPAGAETAAATTTVNIRTAPNTRADVVGRLVRGQRISTVGRANRGWVPVRFDGRRAYMAASYLAVRPATLPPAPRRIGTTGTKIATETLNVRSGPGARYRVVGRLAEGQQVRLTGRLSAGFAQFRYGGRLRWASLQYLAGVPGSATSADPGQLAPGQLAPGQLAPGQQALAFARRQLGKPYRWGAEGPSSFDCSGLTMMAWRTTGVRLPRTSRQQYRANGLRVRRSELRPGDLVFFYRAPSHVALYVGNGRILHAPRPGKVVQYADLDSMPFTGAVRPG